jgi:transposase
VEKKLPHWVKEEVERQQQGGKPVRLMFQDEGRFGRISDPRRCWSPPGIRPEVPVQVVRESTFVFAAVSPHDGTMDSLILPEANTEMMSLFLEEVAERHRDEFVLMVMDQAGWHTANHLKIPDNLRLIWLPPYSPQCNPVEHVWDEIREKWFANRVFHSMDAVEDTLMDALASLEKNKQKMLGITGFNWIISIPMNATLYKKYDKADHNLFFVLQDKIDTARQRAKKMNKKTENEAPRDKNKKYQFNPYTDVYKLLDAIDDFVKKSE